MEKQIGNRQFKGAAEEKKEEKMAAIILAAQIGSENVRSNEKRVKKIQEKTKRLQLLYSSSQRRSLPGNRSSNSLICVMTHGLSLSSTLNLIDSFDTRKESISLLVKFFWHFHQRIL